MSIVLEFPDDSSLPPLIGLFSRKSRAHRLDLTLRLVLGR